MLYENIVTDLAFREHLGYQIPVDKVAWDYQGNPKKPFLPFEKVVSGSPAWPPNEVVLYNFTPLNANISKVLMEIKRDLEYQRPPKIPEVPPNQNSSKYCEFHKANGHYTEGCIAMR
jgi:hypothetical protein